MDYNCSICLFCYLFFSEYFLGILISLLTICGTTLTENYIITGPGLAPDIIVMPARYFFINMTQTNRSRKKLVRIDDLKIDVTGTNQHNRPCRVWVNLLNKNDGVFIARYKLYETCKDVEISVKFDGTHIGNSPFKIQGIVHPEDCYCPMPLEEWLYNYNCPATYAQIDRDLLSFPVVTFTDFHDFVVKKAENSGSMSVCNYVILKNNIYRKCYGQHVGFKMFVDGILTSLARKVLLPDVEMFVNLGDWPLAQKSADKMFPIFSWCGSNTSWDIVIPTYDITESSLEAMGRVSLDILSVQGNNDIPWEAKEPKAFWRGRDSSRERLKLVDIARKHPDLLNASLTNFFFFRDQEDIYGPKEQHVSFFKFFYYRYQVNLDGTVAAYRLPYLLAGGSLVLKQDSHYYEHFYADLSPWTHYVPVSRDLSDLVEKVTWAKNHDEEARQIAKAGQQFVMDNLLPQHIFCYHTVLIKEWSKRLKETVRVREGMEEIPQEANSNCDCSSQRGLHQEL